MTPRALLAEIVANPDDDAPRLVYADHLQGCGDPQGELIAVQCELSRLGLDGERLFLEWIGDELALPAAHDDGRIARLRKREAALLRQHGAEWGAAVRAYAVSPEAVQFRRGFLEHVGWDVHTHIEAGLDVLAEAAPHLRSLNFASYVRAGSVNALRDFFSSPHLHRLRELYPSSAATQASGALRYFSACGELSSLRRLCLSQVEGHALASLSKGRFLPALEGLVLNGFGDAAELLELLSVPAHIHELQLVDANVGPAIAETVAKLASLLDVRILGVRAARLGPGGAATLLGSRTWLSLLALDLRSNKLHAEDAAAVGQLKTVRVVDLGNNPVGDAGIARLFEKHRFGSLRAISLQKTGLTDAGVDVLAGSPLLADLRVLDLRKNAITDEGAAALAESKRVRGLRTLYIGGNQLTPKGKKMLATSEALEGTRVHT